MSAFPLADAPPSAQKDDVLSLRAALARARAELAAAQEARTRAEAAIARKDEALSIVSHELRGPLGAVLGWTHMLRRGATPAEIEHGLEVIEQSAEVQSRLVEDLLDLSRMGSSRIRLEMDRLQLRDVIAAVAEAARPSVAARRLTLTCTLAPDVPAVKGDATRLRQIIGNLVGNAVKFTPEGGRIDVGLRAASGFAVVTVSDTGIGIAPGFVGQVFEPFRQDPTASHGQGGLGLGLAIAKHLVDLHGGEIAVESAGEGRGATFTVRLPLA